MNERKVVARCEELCASTRTMPKGKKRRAHDAAAPASASPEAALAERVIFEDVVSWLERRKLPVPPALCASGGCSSASSGGSAAHRDAALQRALGWLALKERERRARLQRPLRWCPR